MSFQLENSFPQSNIIDLNKFLGILWSQLLSDFSISQAFLPSGLIVIIHLLNRSTKVITALSGDYQQ